MLEVDEALGHSVFYEDLRGNLTRACELATQALAEARAAARGDAIADGLIALATVKLLQGETRQAVQLLDEVGPATPDDAARLRKAAALRRAAEYVQFDYFPDGGAGYGPEVWIRLDALARPSSLDQQAMVLPPVTDTAALLQTAFLERIPELLIARACVSPGAMGNAQSTAPQLLNISATKLETLRQWAIKDGAAPSVIAGADLQMALLCQRGQAMDEALAYLQRAQQFYQENGDGTGVGACQMYRGDWRVARTSTPLVLNQVIQEFADQSNEWLWRGQVVDVPEAEVEAARGDYEAAETLFHDAGAVRGLAAIELRRSYLATLLNDYPEAARRSETASRGFSDAGDRLGQWLSAAHNALARVGAGGEPEDLDTARSIGSWGSQEGSFSFCLGLGLLMSRIGGVWLMRSGDYERALACHRLAHALFLSLEVPGNVAQALVDQGTILRLIGERDAALILYGDADRLCQEQFQDEGAPFLHRSAAWLRAGSVSANIFQVYLAGLEADGMEQTARRLKELNDSLPSEKSQTPVGRILGGLKTAWAGGRVQQPEPAEVGAGTPSMIRGLCSAMASALQQFQDTAAVFVPTYRAVASRDAGDARAAQRQFDEALAVARRQQGATGIQREAMVLGQQRRREEAAAAYRHFLEQARPDFDGLIEQIGGAAAEKLRAQAEQNQHDEAAEFFCAIKAYREGNDELTALESTADPEHLEQMASDWDHQRLRGEIAEGLGNLALAAQHYDDAIEILESRRDLLLDDELKTALGARSQVQRLYFLAARTAFNQAGSGSAAACLAYVERGKSRALLDLIARAAETASSDLHAGATLAAWREQSAKVALAVRLVAVERDKKRPDPKLLPALERDLMLQQDSLREIMGKLAGSQSNLGQMLGMSSSLMSIDEIVAALAADEVLVEYFYLESLLLVFAVTRDGAVVAKANEVDATTLDRTIAQYHQASQQFSRNMDESAALGADLANWFLRPIADEIDRKAHLTIVPYGASHLLPFHALPWRGESLIASKSVSYLPSAAALRFLRAPGEAGSVGPVLAISSPGGATTQIMPGQQRFFPPLTAANAEAAYIKERFPESELLGPGHNDATIDNVRTLAPRYPILHFAAHCCVSTAAPMATFILLAGGQRLNLYTLMGMELTSRLVVMSACSSGVGQVTRGDDLLGLTRGILAAGARSAVVTIWDLNDDSTAVLMAAFYDGLHDGLSPARALQAAQNELRQLGRAEIEDRIANLKKISVRDVKLANDYAHPYYWAAFTLVG